MWAKSNYQQLTVWKYMVFYTFYISLFSSIFLATRAEVEWETDRIGVCSSIFGSSQREGNDDDSLLLWIGSPSAAIHVRGKHGPFPMPTVWTQLTNVLYISNCNLGNGSELNDTENYTFNVVSFLKSWLDIHNQYKSSQLYVCGNSQDTSGGEMVIAVALALLDDIVPGLLVELQGVFIAHPQYTPSYQFIGHKAFESSNNMNDYLVDRARQDIICNGWYSQVEFINHDVHLYYTPVGGDDGTYDYKLSAVGTLDTCYCDSVSSGGCGGSLDQFEEMWSSRPQTPHADVYATLPFVHADVFCPCNAPAYLWSEHLYAAQLKRLLVAGVSTVMYSTVHKSQDAICSFYIGIYESDAMRFAYDVDGDGGFDTVISSFNRSPMEKISGFEWGDERNVDWHDGAGVGSWQTTVGTLPMQQKPGTSSNTSGERNGTCDKDGEKRGVSTSTITWIQLNSNFASDQSNTRYYGRSQLLLNEKAAIDILQHLLSSSDAELADDIFIELL